MQLAFPNNPGKNNGDGTAERHRILRFFERGHHPLCPGQATSSSHKNTALSFSCPELSRQGLCSACLSTAVETRACVLGCFSSSLWVFGSLKVTPGRGVTFLTQQWTMMKSSVCSWTSQSVSCLATHLHSLSKRLSLAVCPVGALGSFVLQLYL